MQQPFFRSVSRSPQIIARRTFICYRPIQYDDWHKPEGETYYVLKCPVPCPEKEYHWPVTYEKSCKLCSFWQQLVDNCCGYFRPLPPMPMRGEGAYYICKDLRQKKGTLTEAVAELLLKRKSIKLSYCNDVPDLPEHTWEAVRDNHPPLSHFPGAAK